MATSVEKVVNSKSVCLILLIGLPGSGKTFLTNFLMSFLKHATNKNDTRYFTNHCIVPVTYDDFIFSENDYKDCWKDKRRIVFDSVQQLVCDFKRINQVSISSNEIHNLFCNNYKYTDKNNLFIIIDDNMYYRSMRYEYYKLAKTYSTGFCQIYLETTVDKAVEFNRNRINAVPDSVINRMHLKIEPPNLYVYSWEINSISLPSFVEFNDSSVSNKLFNVILSAISSPERSKVVDSFSKVGSTVTKKNLVHEIDLRLRSVINEQVKYIKRSTNNGNMIKVVAEKYNRRRIQIIRDLKTDFGILSSELIQCLQHDNRTKYEDDEISNYLLDMLNKD